MIGYFFAFLTPAFNAAATLFGKKLLNKEHTTTYVASLAFVAFLICIPMFFFIDYSELSLKFLLILFFNCLMGSLAFILVASSIRHSQVSLIAPLLVLGPGITSLMSLLFLKEVMSIQQCFGIFVLIIGAYILESNQNDKMFDPLKNMLKSKYTIYTLIALLLYSFSSVVDKILVVKQDMSVISYIAFAHLFNAIIFMIYINYKFSIKDILKSVKDDGVFLFLIGFFTVGYRFASIEAIKYFFVGVVSAIKRVSSLIVVVVGGELFHEDNILRKTIACLIMVGGVVLLVI